jgi:hypothetical protein
MMKTILVTLVLFHLEVVKTIKVFDTKNESYGLNQKALMMVDGPLKGEEPPLRGYGLFYTCTPEQIRRSQLELCETLA